jgi:hypothetical protein
MVVGGFLYLLLLLLPLQLSHLISLLLDDDLANQILIILLHHEHLLIILLHHEDLLVILLHHHDLLIILLHHDDLLIILLHHDDLLIKLIHRKYILHTKPIAFFNRISYKKIHLMKISLQFENGH